ncbi:MAG TPA: flagellar M-ring protein FliF C-terminal domain-containing protein [Phycisphaerae bacterium]|nr:flagellar M-ring protein FliF C-terminal domain-containing protein [Phycisphaerae bacterium]
MEFLNAQAKYIAQQLRTMSTSQRLAIALAVVGVAVGMWGFIRWGSQSEWTPLLDQSFTGEQIQQIQAELAMAGVPSKLEGDRIFIKGDDDTRRQLTALLAQRGALPRDTSLGYAALAKDDNVFESAEKTQWKQSRGLESELSQVLRKFRGIKDAQVFVEVPKTRGFGGKAATSRASIHVTLLEGESLDKQRVGAIANFVVGAVRGLAVENVKITDGTRFYRAPDASDAMPAEHLDLQRQQEQHYATKIANQLQYIPGVLVNVHAILRSTDEQTQQRVYGKPEVDKESSETEETNGPSNAAAPGVRPNTGRGLADAGSGASSTREKSETSMNGLRDQKDTTVVKPKGYVEKIMASVNVPRSYLLKVLEAQGTNDTSAAAVEKIAAIEMPKIKDLVKPLINATEDEQVVVKWFHDVAPEAQPTTELAQQPAFIAMAKDYGPQAGLALLAAFSLFMVFRIAKKGQATFSGSGPLSPAMAGAGGWSSGSRPTPLDMISTGPETVGEVGEVDGIMVGHEVDEGMVRTQQIINQINQLVKEDPIAPASIIESWIQNE